MKRNANAKRPVYMTSLRISEERRQRTLFEGGHPIFAQACQRKGLPYPKIDEQGQIIAPDEWWQKMQMTQDAWQSIDD